MNKGRLRACVQYFAQEPLRLNMGTWVDTDHQTRHFKNPPCGTVACLAGSAMVLEAQALGLKSWYDACQPGESYEQFGMRYFDLTKQQVNALFYTTNWPFIYAKLYEDFAHDFYECRHPHLAPYIKKQMVNILSMRIEDFITTEDTTYIEQN